MATVLNGIPHSRHLNEDLVLVNANGELSFTFVGRRFLGPTLIAFGIDIKRIRTIDNYDVVKDYIDDVWLDDMMKTTTVMSFFESESGKAFCVDLLNDSIDIGELCAKYGFKAPVAASDKIVKFQIISKK